MYNLNNQPQRLRPGGYPAQPTYNPNVVATQPYYPPGPGQPTRPVQYPPQSTSQPGPYPGPPPSQGMQQPQQPLQQQPYQPYPQPPYQQGNPPQQFAQQPQPHQQPMMGPPPVYASAAPSGPPPPYSAAPLQKGPVGPLPPAYSPAPFNYGQLSAREKELMLLLDRTGSMNWATSPDNPTPRRDTIREAIHTLVSTLARADSQAAHEQGDAGEGGGLRTITFASHTASDIGDLNPSNLRAKWTRIQWAGTTWIVPGWRELKAVYHEEFGGRPAHQRPLLLALVITDGEAEDTEEFAQALAAEGRDGGTVFVVLAVIGTGEEYERALALYRGVASRQHNVRVIPFSGETDPTLIANACLNMIQNQ